MPARRKGFVILIIISLLALLPVVIEIPAISTRQMVADTACNTAKTAGDNIVASARLWTGHNRRKLFSMTAGQVLVLDVEELGRSAEYCKITALKVAKDSVELRIEAGSRYGTYNLRQSRLYILRRDTALRQKTRSK